MAVSNKRKKSTSQKTIKKIDSYFKPVHSESVDLDSSSVKKVKLKTRTLLKHKLVSNESDNEESTIAQILEDTKEQKEGKEEKAVQKEEKVDKKANKEEEEEKVDKEQKPEKEEENSENTIDDKQAKNDEKDEQCSSPQLPQITQTQDLDTQNVPVFSTQTQTQNDTLGSPITYTVADDEDEDSFFNIKFLNTQTDGEKKQEEEVDGFVFSSTQESSLDDFDDIFNDNQQQVNIVSLDFSQDTNNDFKISSNLPDTNLSFPSSAL